MIYECNNKDCVYRNERIGICSLRERDAQECGEYYQTEQEEEK